MIITTHQIKGGAGKTTTILLLLSAIAEHNSNADEDRKISVVAFDADPQGTLANFGRRRADEGLPLPGIEIRHLDMLDKGTSLETVTQELAEADDSFDVVLLDTGGTFEQKNTSVIYFCDLVLIPTGLVLSETDTAVPSVKEILRRTAELEIQMKPFLLISRTDVIETRAAKGIREVLRTAGLPLLSSEVRRNVAAAEMVSRARLLHELIDSDSARKSCRAALDDARRLYHEILDIYSAEVVAE